VGFIENHHGFLGEVFGHHFCHLWVEHVAVVEDNNIGLLKLKRMEDEIKKETRGTFITALQHVW